MRKQLNKLVALLLIGIMTVSVLPSSSFAAVGTGEKAVASRRIGQVTLYQDGALSDAYLEGDWTDQYTVPERGTIEGDLYWGMKDLEDWFSLADYPLTIEEAGEYFQRVINSNPDLFYVSGNLSYYSLDYCVNCDGFVYDRGNGYWAFVDSLVPDLDTGRAWIYFSNAPCNHNETHKHYEALHTLVPQYITNNKNQISSMKLKFDAAVDKALAGIDDNMSGLEKALYCHDYIVKSNNYDYENFTHDQMYPQNPTTPNSDHSAYGALVNRISVCDGYALAYSYLLQRCGIETRLVVSSEMGHAWSAVKLGENWYFVDCTGDDPIWDYSNANSSDRYDYVFHDKFLMSAEQLAKTEYSNGKYRKWTQADINDKANDTTYDNAIWKDIYDEQGNMLQWGVVNEYNYCDGYWYYLDDYSYLIMRTDDPEKRGEAFSSVILNAYDETGNKMHLYGKVSVYTPSKTMYVSTADKIYAIDLTGVKEDEVYLSFPNYDPSSSKGYYGLTVIDDYLYYGTANDPDDKPKLTSIYLGEVKLGDLNNNGKLDSLDALAILDYVAAGKTDPNEYPLANVDGDKKIDALDALAVLDIVAAGGGI